MQHFIAVTKHKNENFFAVDSGHTYISTTTIGKYLSKLIPIQLKYPKRTKFLEKKSLKNHKNIQFIQNLIN